MTTGQEGSGMEDIKCNYQINKKESRINKFTVNIKKTLTTSTSVETLQGLNFFFSSYPR